MICYFHISHKVIYSMFSLFPHCFCCIIAKLKLDDADWTECPSLHAGMHKKSLEMSKKCLSPSESDPARCNPFCSTSERCGRSEAQEVEPEEQRLLEMEEEEDVDEEVAIDLSSSSKQQHPEAGSSLNLTHSPHRQSGGESDEQSWTLGGGVENWLETVALWWNAVGREGWWVHSGMTETANQWTEITTFISVCILVGVCEEVLASFSMWTYDLMLWNVSALHKFQTPILIEH